MRKEKLGLLLILLAFVHLSGCFKKKQGPSLFAITNLADCQQTTVQNGINAATAGDTLNMPAGNCTWTAMTLNKAITLHGAGVGVTVITINGHGAWQITKQASGITRLQNFTLKNINAEDSGGPSHDAVVIGGPWPTGDPIIIQNMSFDNSGATQTMFGIGVPGGVIFSQGTFIGNPNGGILMQVKSSNTASWNGPTGSTLGMLDSTGKLNLYVEDMTFQSSLDGVDCDDNCRIVWRHNTHGSSGALSSSTTWSGGFNSHGHDSSPYGMRQFEVYSNTFNFTRIDSSCSTGNAAFSNINWEIWIRGGSGVIYNNTMAPLVSGCWGTKPMIKLDIRSIEDQRFGTACGSLTYPRNHQLGQSNNGTVDITDPIAFWGNVSSLPGTKPHGFFINVPNGFDWGNPCALPDWNVFFQWGRDAVNTSLTLPVVQPAGGEVEGQGGTPKGGYTAFTYPHPLVTSSPTTAVLSFSPNPAAFGTITQGQTSSPLTVTISNTGNASQTFSGVSFTSSEYVRTGGTVNFSGGTCAAGATCGTVILTFTPSTVGTRNATMNVTGTVTGALPLTGTGQSGVSIPSVPTGVTATAGGTVVNLSWTASTGAPTSYKCLRGTVSGGPYTQFATPTTTSCSDSGLANGTYFYVVQACNSAGCSANSTQVSATILTQASATLNPSLLDFGNVVVGGNSNQQTVNLTNSGNATLTISAINISGGAAADYTQTNNCTSLAAGANCTITVMVNPSALGSRPASLNVSSNDPTSPDSVTLAANGVNATSVSPSSINFGNQNINKTSPPQTVTFRNTSGQTITFGTIALATGTQFAVTVTGTGACGTAGTTLASGLSCTVTVTFRPTSASSSTGDKTDTLSFPYTGASGSPLTVALSGTGKRGKPLRVGLGGVIKFPDLRRQTIYRN